LEATLTPFIGGRADALLAEMLVPGGGLVGFYKTLFLTFLMSFECMYISIIFFFSPTPSLFFPNYF